LGETWQDRLDLATVLRDLEVNSIPVNFLNPVKGTPFESREKISAEEALRIIAMLRIICENATVRVCGGRQTSLQNRQSEIFEAGANGLMTGDFLTTAGTAIQDDLTMIQHCGLTPRLTPVK
jgi:biotin synthase